jgi:hypothetical protein
MKKLALVIVMIAYYPVYGWAIATMWRWFIVPLGLPPLSIAHALGLSILLGFTCTHAQLSDEENKLELYAIYFGRPVMVTLVAWIVHAFM